MTDLRERLQAALGDAYRIERELGGGGMSRLFLAEESSLHRKVVVKCLPPEFASEVSAARFRQEIELAAHLQHPNILPVLTAGTRDDLLYYVIPYVPGESLRHRLTREGRLPVADAIQILQEMADALAHAHAEGILHRDIKPENVLLEGRHPVLTDFGVARALLEARSGERLTETGLAVGTPGYMAPEQVAGDRHVDARADVYALAVVGYEMLSGKAPFEGATAQAVLAAHLTATPRPLTAVRSEVPKAVSDVIARALAKHPGQRLQTAAAFRDALRIHPARPPIARRTWVLWSGIAALLVLGGGFVIARHNRSRLLDADLIAVAPFDVLAPGLELWREGLVDVLSRNLDGAGALRTVAPSTVIRRWVGRADPPSAKALGLATGARIAVFGQVVATSADSVRLIATLYDVGTGNNLGEVELRDQSGAMDRLMDSLTFSLLRELGRSRPIGAVRSSGLRSTTLPALRAFLQGEQFFRNTQWDSALAAYGRAVGADSSFALAWWRLGSVLGWQVIGGDSLSGVYTLQAAALNRGLPPRESLLITADSLGTALFTSSRDTLWRTHQARLFATLEEATRKYPQDPEVWYALGDARLHFPLVGRTTMEQTLDPFDRAIALDSAFTESYLHPVALAISLGQPDRARRYIAAYLGRIGASADKHARGFVLVDRILAELSNCSPELERAIDSASGEALFEGLVAFQLSPDSCETEIRLAQALTRSPRSPVQLYNEPGFRSYWLRGALGSRGHLRDLYATFGDSGTSSSVAPLGGLPEESARHRFQQWLAAPPVVEAPGAIPNGFQVGTFTALPWWAARRDTSSLARFAARMESLATGAPRDTRAWLSYGRAAALAYESLARGDSAQALARFVALPDTICRCVYDQIVKSQLLLSRGQEQEALAVFNGHEAPFLSPARPLWQLQRGRAAERVGQRDRAIDDYQFVVGMWRHADPELQPYVQEAKSALARLTAEPKR
jgi:serine/threonine-protein kinase